MRKDVSLTEQAELELEEDIRKEEESRSVEVVHNEPERVISHDNAVATTKQTDMLLAMAVEKDLDVDKLEKLIELKNKEEDREAKKEFWIRFSNMQKEIPAIKRGKDAGNWKYAPLEKILTRDVMDIVAKHGFAMAWTEDTSVKDIFTAICIISGYGHQEKFPASVPYSTDSRGGKNPLQQRGETKSYARRYAVQDALGIVIEDEDTDGIIDYGQQFVTEVENIKRIDSEPMLNEFYKDLRNRGLGSGEMSFLYSLVKDRKKELREASNGSGD